MDSKRILFINSEITPYLPETEISKIGRYLPQGIQEKGKEIRTFMPKFGKINERRNQLHEVIRLSGMNLIIDDTDHPLIIKVASIQAARMQIYFIDNDDYFQRKYTFTDSEGNDFADNDERAIFYARGVIETVKNLRWVPDVVHCNGWFTALAPLYIKKYYKDDPCFKNSKVVYSVYNDDFKTPMKADFIKKIALEGINDDDLAPIKEVANYENLSKLAVDYSDGVIQSSREVNDRIIAYASAKAIPVLPYYEEDKYIAAYNEFYDKILS